MTQRDAVLFANEAFYVAFGARDMAAMTDLWATRAPVTCIHPGWPPLFGRDEVLESWEGIFSGDASPEITCHGAQPHLYGEMATVLCYERIPESYLIATNVFVREGGLWKIVHHQAGPTQGGPVSDEDLETPHFN
jgi:ketosteroid isomerase-like protein